MKKKRINKTKNIYMIHAIGISYTLGLIYVIYKRYKKNGE